ncbi:MAG TPA: flagellar hook-length control protein FliK, partial [Nitrospiraceae bacterium]|nr:flagellar hook-length control protein FliK [Nitrospiraceae bacterium]
MTLWLSEISFIDRAMEASPIPNPTAGGTPNAEAAQPASNGEDGTFESLLLKLGLHSSPGPGGNAPRDAACADTGKESGTDVVETAPAESNNIEVAFTLSEVLGLFQARLVTAHVDLCAGQPPGAENPANTENAEDVPKTPGSDNTAPPVSGPVPEQLRIDLAALAIASPVSGPTPAATQEGSPMPSPGIPCPSSSTASESSTAYLQTEQPELSANRTNETSSPILDGPPEALHSEHLSVAFSGKDVQPAVQKSASGVEMTVIGSEEAHQETGTLSATPMPMDGEGAAGLYERGGRQPDSKIGDRINTPTDTPANDYSRMAAASPAASAKGERSVSSLALPDGHSHVSPPPAAPLPSSVYFEVQPPDAGRVRVHLALSDQTVYARVVTEQSEVQDFLVRNVGRLESQLQ